MLRKRLVCAIFCVGLGLTAVAPAVQAQTVSPVSAEQSRIAIRNMERATASNARIAELQGEVYREVDFTGVQSPDEFLVRIERILPQVATTRADLRELAAELRALPKVSRADSPPSLRMIDSLVESTATQADRAEASLTYLPDLAEAVRANDGVAMGAALERGKESIALSLEGQALAVRMGSAAFQPDQSEYSVGIAMACMSEGNAAYIRGAFDLVPGAEASSAIAASRACVRENLDLARAAMAREAGARSSNPQTRALQTRLADIATRGLAEGEAFIPVLDRMLSDIADGQARARLMDNTMAANAVYDRLRVIGAEQIEANRRSGR